MQAISQLSPEMINNVEAKRTWVRNHYSAEASHKYDTIKGKLNLLHTIITSNWVEQNETVKLQSLGITLGDIFVQDLGFEWIQVEDENGIDPGLRLPQTSIILFPQTMISKRIECGDIVNIYELYEGIRMQMQEIKNDLQNA